MQHVIKPQEHVTPTLQDVLVPTPLNVMMEMDAQPILVLQEFVPIKTMIVGKIFLQEVAPLVSKQELQVKTQEWDKPIMTMDLLSLLHQMEEPTTTVLKWHVSVDKDTPILADQTHQAPKPVMLFQHHVQREDVSIPFAEPLEPGPTLNTTLIVETKLFLLVSPLDVM